MDCPPLLVIMHDIQSLIMEKYGDQILEVRLSNLDHVVPIGSPP